MQRRRDTLRVEDCELRLVGWASVARSKKATFRDSGMRGGCPFCVFAVPMCGFMLLGCAGRLAGRPKAGPIGLHTLVWWPIFGESEGEGRGVGFSAAAGWPAA